MNGAYGGIPTLRGLEIAAGVFKNINAETKFGHALSLGITKATIWSPLGIYAYPTAATAMTISSSALTTMMMAEAVPNTSLSLWRMRDQPSQLNRGILGSPSAIRRWRFRWISQTVARQIPIQQ